MTITLKNGQKKYIPRELIAGFYTDEGTEENCEVLVLIGKKEVISIKTQEHLLDLLCKTTYDKIITNEN